MAVARPPGDIDGALRPVVVDQLLKPLRQAVRAARRLPGESEGGTLGGAETRPVAPRQLARVAVPRLLVQARDREQHLTVPHSVERLLLAGEHPEHAGL